MSTAGPAIAGRAVDARYRFAVAPGAPLPEGDYVVFVHAFDTRGERLWTADHSPPTPVRLWKRGSIVEYVRPMTVPTNSPPGRVTIALGLYSPGTGERLPLSGSDDGRRSYRVASLDVVASDEPPAIFLDGWHDLEEPSPDIRWHWSKAAGTIWLRNPGRDSDFVLDLDQPMLALGAPQQIGVRIGAADEATFTLPPGQRMIQRIRVTAPQLGQGPMVIVTVVADRTFVPANVPGATSADPRELGVRVFNAYFESP
jgi:hypothetical protein